MSRLQYFVASSLDGFIATSDDNLAWLLQFDGFEGGRESYEAFMSEVGCIVMGGDAYAWLMEHEPDNWPYPDTPCWVFTHHEHSAPRGADITFVRGDVREFMDDFRADAGARMSGWLAGESSRPNSPTPACWTKSSCPSSRWSSVPESLCCPSGQAHPAAGAGGVQHDGPGNCRAAVPARLKR